MVENIYQSLITVNPWTFIAVICNLFIQMYILKRFLLDKVNAVLQARKEQATKQLEDARLAKEEAETMKSDYEASISNAKAEADEIMTTAQKTATARSEELINEARTTATQIKQKAEADIALERKKAVNDIKDEIGGIAMEIASKVVEREIKEADHKDLIDEFIQKVGDAS